MTQSINFLKVLPKSYSRLSAMLMLWVVLAALGILILGSIGISVRQVAAHSKLNQALRVLAGAKVAYNQLAKQYPLLASDTPLINQVNALEAEVQMRRVSLQSIEDLLFRSGFSGYMRDLAEVVPGTLWVNQIQIKHAPESITLNGYAISPDAIPMLIARLANTSTYAHVIFKLFFVKAIKHRSFFKFSVATTLLGTEEEPLANQVAPTTEKQKE
jgi:Tfp pilus assembly protein PilN